MSRLRLRLRFKWINFWEEGKTSSEHIRIPLVPIPNK